MPLQHLYQILEATAESLKEVHNQKDSLAISKYDIDCSALEDFTTRNILEDPHYERDFMNFKSNNNPTLYWFQIMSETPPNEIINALNKFKETNNSRATPALKKKIDPSSKILYVGKVKRLFYGRVIQHLGYHKTPATQGLQLYHWANNIGLKLQLNYIHFPDSMIEIMPLFENSLAKKFNPLIGKHR